MQWHITTPQTQRLSALLSIRPSDVITLRPPLDLTTSRAGLGITFASNVLHCIKWSTNACIHYLFVCCCFLCVFFCVCVCFCLFVFFVVVIVGGHETHNNCKYSNVFQECIRWRNKHCEQPSIPGTACSFGKSHAISWERLHHQRASSHSVLEDIDKDTSVMEYHKKTRLPQIWTPKVWRNVWSDQRGVHDPRCRDAPWYHQGAFHPRASPEPRSPEGGQS